VLERLAITFVIIGGLGMAWLGWQIFRTRLMRTMRPTNIALGKPTLLYFTADYCAVCKAQQSPIVARLATKLGDSIDVQQVDVTESPNLASQYKVLTLPTTVVIDSRGQVSHINYGIAQQSKLEAQLL
jgi:thioredoxin 1